MQKQERLSLPAIEVKSLSKRYAATVALDNVTFSAGADAITVIRGPSACGKTTLLRCIAGLETPDAGTIRMGGCCVSGNGVWVPPVRRGIGMVFQDHALWPHLSVRNHLNFVMRAARLPKYERAARIARLLELVELGDYAHALPHSLSGGQQQRVGIARALALNPAFLLLDEPFANLDERLRGRILAELKRRWKNERVTVLVATHDVEEVQGVDGNTLNIVDLGDKS